MSTVVVPNAVLELPPWLLAGVALGVLLSGLVALAFVLGQRRYGPSPAIGTGGDSENRRRREIRRYLEAIGEPYREDDSLADVAVAFLLQDRGLALTFDARAYFQIQEAGGDAVLLEHELPGASLGARLPFETPEFRTSSEDAGPRRSPGTSSNTREGTAASAAAATDGRAADTRAARERAEERRRVRAAFAALGLSPDADGAAVHAAYRQRVIDVHPDQGGDSVQFQRVRAAYELASEHADRS